MVPRKAAAKKVNSAQPPPATPPPAPTTVYVVMKREGYAADGFHSSEQPKNSIEGVYYSEGQSYAAAIPKIISVYEAYGDEQTELRNIAINERLPLKKRMERIMAAAVDIYEDEETSYHVYKGRLFPRESAD